MGVEDEKPKTEEETPTEDTGEKVVETVPPPPDNDDVKGLLGSLQEQVAELRGMVDGIVQGATRDETPASRPWTHRGSRH